MAVTVTYEFPSSSTPANLDNAMVSGTILTDGSATSITVTHGLRVPNADRSFGFPQVLIEPTTQSVTNLYVGYKDGSVVQFVFSAQVTTFRFYIRRPHTITR